MDHVSSDNPEWTERIYVSIYNVRAKDTILGVGVGPGYYKYKEKQHLLTFCFKPWDSNPEGIAAL
jgi:hypothetical protein